MSDISALSWSITHYQYTFFEILPNHSTVQSPSQIGIKWPKSGIPLWGSQPSLNPCRTKLTSDLGWSDSVSQVVSSCFCFPDPKNWELVEVQSPQVSTSKYCLNAVSWGLLWKTLVHSWKIISILLEPSIQSTPRYSRYGLFTYIWVV